MRQVPMLGFVKEAFEHEKQKQEDLGLHCEVTIDGYTFTTRMCEAGVNIKVIQDALGHSDISTTLNIYADVTKEMKAEEFKGLDIFMYL